jgi:hypothetical protein
VQPLLAGGGRDAAEAKAAAIAESKLTAKEFDGVKGEAEQQQEEESIQEQQRCHAEDRAEAKDAAGAGDPTDTSNPTDPSSSSYLRPPHHIPPMADAAAHAKRQQQRGWGMNAPWDRWGRPKK